MIMKCFRNAWKPGKRLRVSGCGFWKAPVQYGGHVCGGVEFPADGGCVQVEEWVFTGLRRQGDQVCPQGRPGRLVGEVGDELVGEAVEPLDDLGSEEGRSIRIPTCGRTVMIGPARRSILSSLRTMCGLGRWLMDIIPSQMPVGGRVGR
jgi:hypothetical protein